MTCSRSGRSARRILFSLTHSAHGSAAATSRLDLVVVDDAAGVGVHQEHLARGDAALADDLCRVQVEDADLGGQHHQAVVGDPVAGRAQAVAVQHGPDLVAVGEGHGCGPVPRLHQHRVVLVEGPAGRIHGGVVFPGLGDHHHDGLGDGAARRASAARRPRRRTPSRRHRGVQIGKSSSGTSPSSGWPAGTGGRASSCGCP